MDDRHLTNQRLAEIREALMYTDWRSFDRSDVSMLVSEVDRLQSELQKRAGLDVKGKVSP